MDHLSHLVVGGILAVPCLYSSDREPLHRARHRFGLGLVTAAVIYVGFALWWPHDDGWLVIEAAGIVLYSSFYLLALYLDNLYILAVGWLLHPVWDCFHMAGTEGAKHTPEWYVYACIGFDIIMAVVIAWRVNRGDQKVKDR